MSSSMVQGLPRYPLDASMADTADRIKFELLSEYDRTGNVDIARWVTRYPDYREEIIDFWLWARGTKPSGAEKVGPFDATDADITEESLRNAMLAVNFGRQWLSAAVDAEEPDIERLGAEMESVRQKPQRVSKAPLPFKKAVVYTWVVLRLQQNRPSVSRLAVQKATYLLEWGLHLGIFVEHTRKPLGPYDSKARYKDAEPIAIKKGWLKVTGTTLRAVMNVPEVARSAARYVKSVELASQFLEFLSEYSDAQLETFATVHWAIRNIPGAHQNLSARVIERELASTPEWRDKLLRANFSADRLQEAVGFLQKLRLIATT